MASRAAAAVAVLALVCAVQSSLSAAAVPGLSAAFYKTSCPRLEQIVDKHVTATFNGDRGVAPALIRILFHDCFTQGCDASVLIKGPGSERETGPNRTLRPVALDLIDRIRREANATCGQVVSCADITVLATRDALVKAGGPRFPVDLGRRDSFEPATQQVGLLPSPFDDVDGLMRSFRGRNLNRDDLVALSGAHTFGVAHCGVISPRVNSPNKTPLMDAQFAKDLQAKCKTDNPAVTQDLDVLTPHAFDNKYYEGLNQRKGLFKSDQFLVDHPETRNLALTFSRDQVAFFKQFAISMTKMTEMNVLTGKQGEIRAECSVAGRRPRIEAAAAAGDEGVKADM
uniref:Peroxidase n=1 Tax=Hordeum vulgare subsp. vulgare TaxID=112509 RepID=F2DTG0_HORVV|nr:predicted protein [Hordeum vulgare subsp. vulgare]